MAPPNDDDDPFTRCEDCGKVYVTGSAHACHDTVRGGTHTSKDRAVLRALDDGDPDEWVAFVRGRADTAYHDAMLVFDLDAMLVSVEKVAGACPGRSRVREWDGRRRRDLLRTNHYPCMECHNISRADLRAARRARRDREKEAEDGAVPSLP